MSSTPQSETTDEDFKRAFPLPAFHSSEELQYLGTEKDRSGRFWAFICYPYNWIHVPSSARPTTSDNALQLGIRMRWSDEPSEQPAGDYRFVDQIEGEKDPQLAPLLAEFVTTGNFTWVGAVELPFRPDAVTIVDK